MKHLAKRVIGKAFEFSGYEVVSISNAQSLRGHLKQVFDSLKINCVLDVGANEGQYGKLLRGIGYRGHIVSFEPVEEAYSSLQESVKNDNAWYGCNFALGSENVLRQFNVSNGSDVSSFLTLSDYGIKALAGYRNNNEPITKTKYSRQVEIKTLNSVLDNLIKGIHDPRIFLKMDTQGYDLEVMKGANRCLDKVWGLQSEISVLPLYDEMPDYLQSLHFFTDLGYALTGLYPVIREPGSLKVVEYDCVMIREQQHGLSR
jgi:FkbM family methyltransferase